MSENEKGIPGYTGPGGHIVSEQEKERQKNAMSGKDLLLSGVVVAVMLVGFWFLSDWMRSGPGDPVEKTQDNDPKMALTMTQVIAEKHLAAPATADWASTSQSRVQPHPEGGWLVNTYVDAQNAFGAQIRNQVTAVLAPSADGETWRASYLEIGDQVVVSRLGD